MKKLDIATLGTVAGGTICAPCCPPPCPPPAPVCPPPAPSCGSSKSKKC
ncbi:hypothetical protein [Methylobacterium frigidaeris]|uniref:Uncharacterized protein n=1 Tax=Methylobacterium frigidaeris TaxID=2038277 RepID=A0AA37M2K0_9HYPH|nr:hypothetical protein [Methylobacterium frigidaeris]GJD60653.1 hypothetical protein MPEAHAMD_0792 [Methylobacterium frigidaeris]